MFFEGSPNGSEIGQNQVASAPVMVNKKMIIADLSGVDETSYLDFSVVGVDGIVNDVETDISGASLLIDTAKYSTEK